VPGYGVCVDSERFELHFLPKETRLYQRGAKDRGRKSSQSYASFLASSGDEKHAVVPRLQSLIGKREENDPRLLSQAALSTPLGKAIQENLPHWLEPPFSLLLLRDGAISVRKNAGRIGVLHQDRAAVGGITISSNFLGDSPAWAELDRELKRAIAPPSQTRRAPTPSGQPDDAPTPRPPSGWRPQSARPLPPPPVPNQPRPTSRSSPRRHRAPSGDTRPKISEVPANVPEDLAMLCLEASRRARLERNVAFSNPVELRGGGFAVTFAPLEGDSPRLTAPFTVKLPGGHESSGVIWLWTSDPLTLVFSRAPRPQDEVAVWAVALLGFADLTAWEDPTPSSPYTRDVPRTSPRGRISEPASSQTRRFPGLRRRRDGKMSRRGSIDRASLQAHMVVGHRRWLPDGWEASSEKAAEAASLGIDLAPGQTWVSAHTRAGVASLGRLSVRWDPPDLLTTLIRRSRARRSR
jgi:hypothetical protein